MMRSALIALPFLASASLRAHDGHGARTSAHLHAFDLVGLVAVAVLIAAWLWRRHDR